MLYAIEFRGRKNMLRTDRPTNGPADQRTDQPTDRPTNGPTNQRTDQPTD